MCLEGGGAGALLTFTPKVPSLAKSAAIAVAAILPGVMRISHCMYYNPISISVTSIGEHAQLRSHTHAK